MRARVRERGIDAAEIRDHALRRIETAALAERALAARTRRRERPLLDEPLECFWIFVGARERVAEPRVTLRIPILAIGKRRVLEDQRRHELRLLRGCRDGGERPQRVTDDDGRRLQDAREEPRGIVTEGTERVVVRATALPVPALVV